MSDVAPIVIDKTPAAVFDDGVGVLATTYPRGTHLPLHRHDTAQLLFAASGTMQVTTPTGRWLVPQQRAVWLPPRFPHAVDMLTDVAMRSTYMEPGALRRHAMAPPPATDRVIGVSPLMRALILALFEPGVAARRRRALMELLLDEVAKSPAAPTFVPMPQSAAMARVAKAAIADIACRRDLADLAEQAGTSARSISRLFPAETSLTFKTWRQRVRIMAALERLGAGATVKDVAARLGFSSSAAFAVAFRSVMGHPPGSAHDADREPPR
jgi:AraC-like DNA-binding protein